MAEVNKFDDVIRDTWALILELSFKLEILQAYQRVLEEDLPQNTLFRLALHDRRFNYTRADWLEAADLEIKRIHEAESN